VLCTDICFRHVLTYFRFCNRTVSEGFTIQMTDSPVNSQFSIRMHGSFSARIFKINSLQTGIHKSEMADKFAML
jgi:hypothetical protein